MGIFDSTRNLISKSKDKMKKHETGILEQADVNNLEMPLEDNETDNLGELSLQVEEFKKNLPSFIARINDLHEEKIIKSLSSNANSGDEFIAEMSGDLAEFSNSKNNDGEISTEVEESFSLALKKIVDFEIQTIQKTSVSDANKIYDEKLDTSLNEALNTDINFSENEDSSESKDLTENETFNKYEDVPLAENSTNSTNSEQEDIEENSISYEENKEAIVLPDAMVSLPNENTELLESEIGSVMQETQAVNILEIEETQAVDNLQISSNKTQEQDGAAVLESLFEQDKTISNNQEVAAHPAYDEFEKIMYADQVINDNKVAKKSWFKRKNN